ncbi:DUF4145 domain-containing protein [Amycolatopsis thermophila]|uniref:DUF4145 domain-containing protein n=1 Tax=Amycolatopsis thermophila TaxID=206084 RepID=A0ABU0EMR1_9PSEU|nr:DUF4145 domain-containing protein [Amycolatopsis thermophila]MDQ0376558.1 hypothetical protein [Amycolatopsis thermophila]
MANRVCWHCGVSAHQTPRGDEARRAVDDTWSAVFACDECGQLSIARTAQKFTNSGVGRSILAQMHRGEIPVIWLPRHPIGRDFPDVPDHIASAASEAHADHSIGSFRSAVLLARSVIEATAKDKGITGGNLDSKINELHTRGLIRELVREQAHEVRFLGNDMAHGDFVEPVFEEESAEILELMGEVLEEVYQAPARLEARRQARRERREGAGAAG